MVGADKLECCGFLESKISLDLIKKIIKMIEFDVDSKNFLSSSLEFFTFSLLLKGGDSEFLMFYAKNSQKIFE